MNEALHREEIIRSLQKEAGGSFSVIHQALSELSQESGTHDLEVEEVRERIREIVNKQRGPQVAAE